MDKLIIDIANSVVREYARMLEKFRPAKLGSEYLEQNLITLFAHNYLKMVKDGAFFTETPFMNNLENAWDWHLDGFAFDNEVGYFIEAKGLGESISNFKKASSDIDRLVSVSLKKSIGIMFNERGHIPPKHFKKLILADCWKVEVANTWKNHPEQITGRCKTEGVSLVTKSFPIGEYGKYQYFLLVGQVIK
jgi:hypothetical protein